MKYTMAILALVPVAWTASCVYEGHIVDEDCASVGQSCESDYCTGAGTYCDYDSEKCAEFIKASEVLGDSCTYSYSRRRELSKGGSFDIHKKLHDLSPWDIMAAQETAAITSGFKHSGTKFRGRRLADVTESACLKSDAISMFCINDICTAEGMIPGALCTMDAQCSSHYCVENVCVLRPEGKKCSSSEQCDGYIAGTHTCDYSSHTCVAASQIGDACDIPTTPPNYQSDDDDDHYDEDDASQFDDDTVDDYYRDFDDYDGTFVTNNCNALSICVPNFSDSQEWPSSGICIERNNVGDGQFSKLSQVFAFVNGETTVSDANGFGDWGSVWSPSPDCASNYAKWDTSSSRFLCTSESEYKSVWPSFMDLCDSTDPMSSHPMQVTIYGELNMTCSCSSDGQERVVSAWQETGLTYLSSTARSVQLSDQCKGSYDCALRAVASDYQTGVCQFHQRDLQASNNFYYDLDESSSCFRAYRQGSDINALYCDDSFLSFYCDPAMSSYLGPCDTHSSSVNGSPKHVLQLSLFLTILFLFMLL